MAGAAYEKAIWYNVPVSVYGQYISYLETACDMVLILCLIYFPVLVFYINLG